MKRTFLCFCSVLLSVIFCHVSAQGNQEAMQKAWMEHMTPGNTHKMLSKADGQWTVETTLWMEPGAQPVKSTGTADVKMILGGRYQESKHSGNMMGMPFEGISVTGYDNAKKVFVNSWVDNMGTGMMNMEGKWDDNTKTINFSGKVFDPMTNKEMMVRETFKMIDDNTQSMEMFMTHDGKEFKSMELKLTRKK